jgi:G3E family GTPase
VYHGRLLYATWLRIVLIIYYAVVMSLFSNQSNLPAGSTSDLTNPNQRAVVVSGTLGSGKTTLLNWILSRQDRLSRPGSFVVIENDIGSSNTDAARLNTDPGNVFEITAGCVCCNDLHSLRAALTQLQNQPLVKTIFIETTGIAKPAAVKDLLHEKRIPTLVIITVDAKHFAANKKLGRINDTVPYADVIALTWTEDAKGSQDIDALAAIINELKDINPAAAIIEILSSGAPKKEFDLSNSFLPDLGAAHDMTPKSLPNGDFSESSNAASIQPIGRSVANDHKVYTLNLDMRGDLSPQQVMDGIREIVSDGLLRAKGRVEGFELDCTFEDWSFRPSENETRASFITLISTRPLQRGDFAALVRSLDQDEIVVDLTDDGVMSEAIELVDKLISIVPTDVVKDGNLVTESHAGEAWRYVSMPEFPPAIKERFLLRLCEFYLKQSEALLSGAFDSHASLPYYQREVGYNLSWFLIDCGDLLLKWGYDSRITNMCPVSLYFKGLKSAKDARHIGTFKASDKHYLQKRLAMLKEENGAISDAQEAIENCNKLCLDKKSWVLAQGVLHDFLQSEQVPLSTKSS